VHRNRSLARALRLDVSIGLRAAVRQSALGHSIATTSSHQVTQWPRRETANGNDTASRAVNSFSTDGGSVADPDVGVAFYNQRDLVTSKHVAISPDDLMSPKIDATDAARCVMTLSRHRTQQSRLFLPSPGARVSASLLAVRAPDVCEPEFGNLNRVPWATACDADGLAPLRKRIALVGWGAPLEVSGLASPV
jgi:hypothetical protein